MAESIKQGDCVTVPDGRIGRVRDVGEDKIKVRLRRVTSKTHQFVFFNPSELKLTSCPKGWMSPDGYNRYLKITLAKMKDRNDLA